MNKKYNLRLSQDERQACQEVIVEKWRGASQNVKQAQILPEADIDGPGWTDQKISESFDCRVPAVESLRKQLF